MPDQEILTAALLDADCLTLEELAGACSVSREWVIRHVEEGFLAGRNGQVVNWRFNSTELWRARQIHALERDFDAVPELAALVADLMQEVESLRARLRRAGLE